MEAGARRLASIVGLVPDARRSHQADGVGCSSTKASNPEIGRSRTLRDERIGFIFWFSEKELSFRKENDSMLEGKRSVSLPYVRQLLISRGCEGWKRFGTKESEACSKTRRGTFRMDAASERVQPSNEPSFLGRRGVSLRLASSLFLWRNVSRRSRIRPATDVLWFQRNLLPRQARRPSTLSGKRSSIFMRGIPSFPAKEIASQPRCLPCFVSSEFLSIHRQNRNEQRTERSVDSFLPSTILLITS